MAQATRRTQPAKPAPRPQTPQSKATRAAQAQGRPAPDPKPAQQTVRPGDVGRMPATPKNPTQSREVLDPAQLNQLPAHMRGDADMGKEAIGRDDIETPRLKLMQGLSPELTEYDELRPGMFFHSAAEHIFDEPFKAVPIFVDKQYILWRPRDAGGGILARANDGIHWSPDRGEFRVRLDKKDGGNEVTWRLAPTVQQSGLANWGTMNPDDTNSPPAATLMYNFVFAFPEYPDLIPAVLTFQRSSIRMGRKLNTKLKTVRTPLFGSMFTISAFEDANGAGQNFWNVQATGAGLVEDPQLYAMYKALHMSLREKGLNIQNIDGMQDEGAAGTPGY